MRPQSKTDWDRVKRDANEDLPVAFDASTDTYDPNDQSATTEFWSKCVVRRGAQRSPLKVPTTIRFDADVLAALKASGKGWQTRVNEAMREWLKSHSAA